MSEPYNLKKSQFVPFTGDVPAPKHINQVLILRIPKDDNDFTLWCPSSYWPIAVMQNNMGGLEWNSAYFTNPTLNNRLCNVFDGVSYTIVNIDDDN